MYDELHPGRVKSTEFDKDGYLLATLDEVPEGEFPKVPIHDLPGHQARPLDGKASCVYAILGDVAEVFTMDDPAAAARVAKREGAGKIEKGETRVFSVGKAPNGILLKDDAIKVGTNAQKGAAREGDDVDLGDVKVTAGAGGAITAIEWKLPNGTVLTFNAGAPGPFKLIGRITGHSDLVKIE